MKICRNKDCGQANPQPVSAFFKDRGLKDGHSNTCKVCKKSATAAWREKNRHKWNLYMRRFRAEHPASLKEKFHNKNRVMRCRYGMEMGEYNSMLIKQSNKCAICEKSIFELSKPLAVDHCHGTKKVRGLLCFSCNRSIAILDNPRLLERAKAYLKI